MTTGYSEDYKRFYYRDIQALITRKTAHGNLWTVMLGIVTVIFFLTTVTVSGVAAVIFGSLAGFFLLCLLINWLRGPTCVCHLRTAVQLERLPSLNRLRTARKAIQRIKAKVAEAQGTIPPEELQARIQELTHKFERSFAARTPEAAADYPSEAVQLQTHPAPRLQFLLPSKLCTKHSHLQSDRAMC